MPAIPVSYGIPGAQGRLACGLDSYGLEVNRTSWTEAELPDLPHLSEQAAVAQARKEGRRAFDAVGRVASLARISSLEALEALQHADAQTREDARGSYRFKDVPTFFGNPVLASQHAPNEFSPEQRRLMAARHNGMKR